MEKNNLLDRYQGCLIGLACGDALGLPFEYWKPAKTKEYINTHGIGMKSFRFGEAKYPAGFYSDDTATTICLGDSLIEKGFDVDDQYTRYRRWYMEGYGTPDGKCFGIGGHTMQIMLRQKKAPLELMNDEKAGGNGPLPRTAALALYIHGHKLESEIEDLCLRSTIVTHNNRLAIESCILLAVSIIHLCDGLDKEQLINAPLSDERATPISVELKEMLELVQQPTPDGFSTSGYCLNTLGIALWGFLNTETFESCINTVIGLGGDADTNAAVAGALAGTYYGLSQIPEDWKNNLMMKDRIVDIADRL